MHIALVADPHVSLTAAPHSNIRLCDTPKIVAAIVADMEQRRPDLAIWLGDLTHDGTPEVRARFAQLVRAVTVPCLWMLGNHDVEHVRKRDFARDFGPCVARQTLWAAGWDIVMLDTVPELSPRNPLGIWPTADVQLLSAVAAANAGPLLVLAHHPPRSKYLDMEPFWRATAGFTQPGVFIGGHSHRDLLSRERGWTLVDVSSCCRAPVGYHLLELSPTDLSLRFVPVAVELTGLPPTDWTADEPIFPVQVPVPSSPG